MNEDPAPNPLQRLLRATARIEANELRATIASFVFIFTLMTAYFIMRPVRDAMASDWSDVEVSFLWTGTFFFSLIAVSLYGEIISRIPFKRVVPAVYSFFALSFLALYVATQSIDNPVLLEKSYYVWLSVFSLFHLSVFWSFMSDLYNRGQAKRLFAPIATGASLGAIVGSALSVKFATIVGTEALMLVSAVLLLVPVPLVLWLMRLKTTDLGNHEQSADLAAQQELGKRALAGFSIFLQSKFLIGIGVFIILYVAIGSFIYFELKNLLEPFSRDERTQIWGAIDLATNLLTFIIGWFITGRIATRFGMPTTLALIPVFVVAGMLIIAMSPIVAVVAAMQVARRGGNYSVTRPAREMLFTAVDRETRFKAKPVIDIVLYRGGDMVTAWGFTLLTTGLGLGLGAVAAVGAAIAAVWAMVGAWLGREYQRKSAELDAVETANEA